MNDFIIQGVTILGTEVTSYATWGIIFGFIFSCIVILFGFFLFVGCIEYGNAELIPFVLMVLACGIISTKLCWEDWHKSPETVYTISIDDTARYNEIKNNFYYIRELPNGLYEVKLKSMNS